MSTTAINYRETHFEYPELTRVHGEPTFESLITMENELKANAQTVYSDLGGGAHGYLGLVLPPPKYAMISNVPFIKPPHPGPLVIPPNTTQHMATTLKESHTESIRVFREAMGVEKALLQQIVTAIPPKYIAALRDRNTNVITCDIHTVIRHLFDVYGNVTPQTLQDKEQEVKATVYDLRDPIDSIFTKIEDLLEFSGAAGSLFTQPQCINIAYVILNKTGKFQLSIRDWNRKSSPQKTWINFKDPFRSAHKELRESTDITLQDSHLNHANLVKEVVEGVQQVLLPSTAEDSVDDLLLQVANAAKLKSSPSPTLPTGPRRERRQYYCWTHGLCYHSGDRCRTKKEGHQDTATLQNKMGGNTRGCSTSN